MSRDEGRPSTCYQRIGQIEYFLLRNFVKTISFHYSRNKSIKRQESNAKGMREQQREC